MVSRRVGVLLRGLCLHGCAAMAVQMEHLAVADGNAQADEPDGDDNQQCDDDLASHDVTRKVRVKTPHSIDKALPGQGMDKPGNS